MTDRTLYDISLTGAMAFIALALVAQYVKHSIPDAQLMMLYAIFLRLQANRFAQ